MVSNIVNYKHTRNMEQQAPNLLLDVPIEVMKLYFNHLDFQSTVMLSCVCQVTLDKSKIFAKEEEYFTRLINDTVALVKNAYSVVTSIEGKKKLLASMLRKLIYTSVTELNDNIIDDSHASRMCKVEYDALYQVVTQALHVNIQAFNNMLEDAQVEYRGLSIIGLNTQRRTELDEFKRIVETRYFGNPFSIHTYISYKNIFIELNFDGVNISYDIHVQDDDESVEWMFFQDRVEEWAVKQSQCDKSNQDPLYKDYLKSIIDNEDVMSFNVNDAKAPLVIAQLIRKIMKYKPMFKGTHKAKLEFWNEEVQNNWLLGNEIDSWCQAEQFSTTLSDFTFTAFDEFFLPMSL